eukprot:1161198-Pelagomonas_calceolata.AAC.5
MMSPVDEVAVLAIFVGVGSDHEAHHDGCPRKVAKPGDEHHAESIQDRALQAQRAGRDWGNLQARPRDFE